MTATSRLDAARDRLRAVDLRPFLTPRTLADRLAISERTARQMLADGRIASYRIAGCRRGDVADLDAYLARCRQDAR